MSHEYAQKLRRYEFVKNIHLLLIVLISVDR